MSGNRISVNKRGATEHDLLKPSIAALVRNKSVYCRCKSGSPVCTLAVDRSYDVPRQRNGALDQTEQTGDSDFNT